ncbi:MAG: hypothetical protein IJX31_02360 [Clostridia bacterium]|nr:hypothetical protein [Clostridia bacterium]
MSTDFFRKKLYKIVAGFAAVCFTAFCLVYALFLFRAKTVEIKVGFFYLVREESNVEVGVEFVKLEGGAGYLLRQDGKDYVVLSVYFNEKDGLAVQSNIINGGKTQLLYVGVDTLYFKTEDEKKNAPVYVGALQTLREYMEVFSQTITLLEDGATQESIKRILSPLSRQFFYLSRKYADIYPDFSSVCQRYAKRIEEYCAKILFVGDLRYELCAMTGDYLTLANKFSI